ncbi:Uncharacterized protein TCM_044564 [Theobroma cacao]|uniref:Gag-pro-like protein n=1 Tax=Theobroma cacao TaxID=3641 RepID=A0A061FQT3_THECC|nr:Uncharacterized protein TCM_044564 [Theobroma cacao]
MMELMISFSKGKRVIEEPTPSKNPPAQDSGNQRDDPPYPPRFTPPHAQTSQRVHPQVMPSVYYNAPPPMGHQPTHGFDTMDATELCLVPDVLIPAKFKVLEFEKYDGTKCPMAHITMYCRKMVAQSHDDKLLIQFFQDSLIGSVARWYTMEKKQSENFKEYAQKWRDTVAQVQPPLTDKEMTVLFINTFRAPLYERLIGNATKNFTDLVLSGEIIKGAIKSGKIEGHEVANSKKGNTSKKKEGDVQAVAHDNQQAHNFNPYYPYPPYQPFYPNIGNITQNPYVYQPTPQPTFQTNVLPQTPPSRPVASTNNPGHGHSTENCITLKHKVQALIKAGLLNFAKKDSSSVDGNPLPNHGRPTVNAIHEGMIRRVKKSIDEIQTPMDKVFEALSKINAITPEPIDTKELGHDLAYSCKFHIGAIGHSIQNCDSFRDTPAEVASSSFGANKPKPLTIFYEENRSPMNDTSPTMIRSGITIEVPSPFPYKSDKAVPWNYECNILSTTSSALQASFEDLTGVGAHRNALLKVLNQAYVSQDISVEKLNHIVGNITVGNFISFNDEEIPSGGRGSNKALHITIKCKDHTVPRVLVDNGSALNVMPRSTLTKLPIDVSYMRTSRMVIRAFDGTTREVGVHGFVWQEPYHLPFTKKGDRRSPECSFRSFEFVNATYVGEGEVIPTPRFSIATKVGVKQTVGKGCHAGLGLEKNLQGINRPLTPIKNEERFGLGYTPTKEERRKLATRKKIKRMAQLEGKEEEFRERTIPHLYETFHSAGFIHPEAPTKVNQILRVFDELSIHMIKDEEPNEKIPVVYPEEKEILPHQKLTETINLENGEEKKELPLGSDCKPIKQKLRRMKPEMLLKITEEVKKQFDAGFLEVAKYPEWVANIVPVPKKDGKQSTLCSHSWMAFLVTIRLRWHPKIWKKQRS